MKRRRLLSKSGGGKEDSLSSVSSVEVANAKSVSALNYRKRLLDFVTTD